MRDRHSAATSCRGRPAASTPHSFAASATTCTAGPLRFSCILSASTMSASVCCGRRLRAVELYAGIGWTGRTSLVAPSNKCMQYAAAAALDGAARSARLRRVDDSLELLGPATTITPLVGAAAGGANASGGAAKMRWKVVGVATPSLDALRFAVERVRAGAAVAAVALYRKPRYAGERLILRGGALKRGAAEWSAELPAGWRGKVRSVALLPRCDVSGLECATDDDAPPVAEYEIAAEGEAVYSTAAAHAGPALDLALGLVLPLDLARGAHGTFHVYNPTLRLVRPPGGGAEELEVVARLSNYNFCTNKHTFDANVREANGALMSFVVRGTLNATSWEMQTATNSRSSSSRDVAAWKMWGDVNTLYPVVASDMVSGPEDPRVIAHRGAARLFVAVWESTKVQWLHMVSVPTGGGSGNGGGGVRSVRLEVHPQFAQALQPWLKQFRQVKEQRDREKNWTPFQWAGGLYLEYSLQPRLVVSLNTQTGVATPVLPLTSSPSVGAWVSKLGPVSGGTPPVYVPGHDIFLGLAHVKLWKKKGSKTATSTMMYKHFWYTFEPRPPFAVLGVSTPFTLPTLLGAPPSIQFATGLVVRPASQEVLVSYGEMDCYATVARYPLAATLAATRPRRGLPRPLISVLVLLPSVDGSSADAAAHLRRLMPLFRLLRDGDGGSDGAAKGAQARGAASSESVAKNGAAPAEVTLLLTERCEVPDALGTSLDELRVRRGCLTCSWDAVASRQPGESDDGWAGRIYRELTCFGSGTNLGLTAQIGATIRGSAQLDAPRRAEACRLLCSDAELAMLCYCAEHARERTAPVASATGALANVLRVGHYALVLQPAPSGGGAAPPPPPHARAAACLTRLLAPNAVLGAAAGAADATADASIGQMPDLTYAPRAGRDDEGEEEGGGDAAGSGLAPGAFVRAVHDLVLERAADGPPAPLWPDEACAPVMRCLELALRTARGEVDDDAAARKLEHEIGC